MLLKCLHHNKRCVVHSLKVYMPQFVLFIEGWLSLRQLQYWKPV
jgi:hypothetical protein